MGRQGKERRMKPSLRIPLTLTVIVVMTGVIVFIKRTVRGVSFPPSYFVIWIIVSAVLIGITVWSWLRNKKK
jgi:predicted tellurium resistance membrane protein TerC